VTGLVLATAARWLWWSAVPAPLSPPSVWAPSLEFFAPERNKMRIYFLYASINGTEIKPLPISTLYFDMSSIFGKINMQTYCFPSILWRRR
jgi:hypothetical protein